MHSTTFGLISTRSADDTIDLGDGTFRAALVSSTETVNMMFLLGSLAFLRAGGNLLEDTFLSTSWVSWTIGVVGASS